MTAPLPTPIYRITHLGNLPIFLQRDGLHSPNHYPQNGLLYRTIHDSSVQATRHMTTIPCGPGGTAHDYVAFYFGPLSPMLLKLKSGQVPGYNEGQEPLIYLKSTCQEIVARHLGFVFSDGHGIAAFTSYYDSLDRLGEVDWDVVNAKYWADTNEQPDRKRRKQAEFLVHRFCPWEAIQEIAVINQARQRKVEAILARFPRRHQPVVSIHGNWYY